MGERAEKLGGHDVLEEMQGSRFNARYRQRLPIGKGERNVDEPVHHREVGPSRLQERLELTRRDGVREAETEQMLRIGEHH